MGGKPTTLGTQGTLPSATVRITATVGAAPAVAPDLPTDRRGRAFEPGRDCPYRSAGGNPSRNLLTLAQRQRYLTALMRSWADSAFQRQNAVNPALVPSLESSRNISNALTAPPPLPQLALLTGGEPAS